MKTIKITEAVSVVHFEGISSSFHSVSAINLIGPNRATLPRDIKFSRDRRVTKEKTASHRLAVS
jgi:hypothetical protein